MASFQEHINQASKNLQFLCDVNSNINDSWDWQVTISFYAAVHLINAHVAKTSNQHYRSHEDVSNAINPFNTLSPSRLPEDIYLSYTKLQALSRRSRYLINEQKENRETKAFFTYDKHFSKAIKNIDVVLKYIEKSYSVSFPKTSISCIELKKSPLTFFNVS